MYEKIDIFHSHPIAMNPLSDHRGASIALLTVRQAGFGALAGALAAHFADPTDDHAMLKGALALGAFNGALALIAGYAWTRNPANTIDLRAVDVEQPWTSTIWGSIGAAVMGAIQGLVLGAVMSPSGAKGEGALRGAGGAALAMGGAEALYRIPVAIMTKKATP